MAPLTLTTPGPTSVGDPVTLTVASKPIQVCPPVNDQVLLFNNSLTEIIYAGYTPNITPFNANPIQPLTYGVMSGRKQIYAFCPTAKVAVTVTPGGTYASASPAQIASQVQIAGIGSPIPKLVSSKQQIAGIGAAFGPLTFDFAVGGAYQLAFTQFAQLNACVADITVQHQDTDGNIVYTENFTVAVGSIGNFSPVIYRGNLQASRIIVSGTTCTQAYLNALPLDTGPFNVTGLSMAVYSLGNALQNTSPKMIPSNTTNGVLQSFQAVSLGAGLSGARVPVFSYIGRFKWDVFSASAGFARAAINFFTVAGGASPQGVLRTQNDNSVVRVDEWEMQGMFAMMQVTNEGGTTANITSHAIIVDYV